MAMSLTPKAIDYIVASVEHGSSLRQAAKANHFTDDQVDDWRRIARGETHQRGGSAYSKRQVEAVTELTERCECAIAERYTVLTNSLYHNATTLNPKTGWYDGQAIDKLLSKSADTRELWYEHRQGAQPLVAELHPVHQYVRELSDAEFEALEQKMLSRPPSA